MKGRGWWLVARFGRMRKRRIESEGDPGWEGAEDGSTGRGGVGRRRGWDGPSFADVVEDEASEE